MKAPLHMEEGEMGACPTESWISAVADLGGREGLSYGTLNQCSASILHAMLSSYWTL